jgi:hypothetical protein
MHFELWEYGIYEVHAEFPCYRVDHHMARVRYNFGGPFYYIYGSSAFSGSGGDYAQTTSVVEGRIYYFRNGLSACVAHSEHQVQTARAGDGKGTPCNFAGISETYAIMVIHKVDPSSRTP